MKKILYTLLLCLATVSIAQAQKVQITTEGIGAIKVGENISAMPKSIDDLYDQITSEQREDMGDTYTCYQFVKDGSTIAQVDDFSNQGEMSSVEILSPNFEIEGISVGSPVSQLFNLPKAKQVHQRDGEFYFEIENVIIKVDEFSESGLKKLNDAYSAGTNATLILSDFKSDAVVKSIVCNGIGADDAVVMNDDTQNSAGYDAVGDIMDGTTSKGKSDTLDTIMNIALLVVLIAILLHMIVSINKEKEPRIFVGSILRMVLLAALCLSPVVFGFGRDVSFWHIAFQIVGTALFLASYYYAYQRPVSLFLKDKPSKSIFFGLPGLWDYITFDSSRIDRERKKYYDAEIEKAHNKINNEWLTEKEYQEQKTKINDAQFGSFADTLYMWALKWIVVIAVTMIYLSLTPFVTLYSYFKNYILYKEKKEI